MATSRFDSTSCTRKVDGKNNIPWEEANLEVLKSRFSVVVPWSRFMKQVITRRFEIIGIPLHLWNDLTLHSIGSCLREVVEIHNLKYSFDTTKVTIRLDDRIILQ